MLQLFKKKKRGMVKKGFFFFFLKYLLILEGERAWVERGRGKRERESCHRAQSCDPEITT